MQNSTDIGTHLLATGTGPKPIDPFLNPLQDSILDCENFECSSTVVNLVSLLFAILILIVVIYAMYLTFEWSAFWFSILLTIAIFIVKPDVLDGLKKNPILQYYSLFITFSLMMALSEFTNSNNYLFLIIINVLISVVSFLTQIKWFVAVSIYLNIYVLSLIATVYRNNGFV